MNFKRLWLAGGALLATVLATAAFAQSGGGCQAEALQDPPRTVLTCPNAVRIVAEDGTDFDLENRSSAAGPEAVRLDGRALLIEAPAGAVEGGFEVITPQAIAAVRGTKWAVDVADGKTSVFVVTGRVAVARGYGSPGVELEPGEGVDVEAGTAPLTVRQWGAARVAALLARFGE
jgi:ferric-dicitrate binding protein FerR (iron transport regulator)